MSTSRYGMVNCPIEWGFASGRAYGDPFNEIEVDVVLEGPGNRQLRVPAYWAGDQEWRVRFAAPQAGQYRWRSVCSDTKNVDLHGEEGTLEVTPYGGANELLRHGAIRVADNRRHFEHADGTPFFWLADTWWMGLCSRLQWPDEFQSLARDRREKGFSVIQIVAGPYPDMTAFDPRGKNEAGFPWESDFRRVNPAYYDMADTRMAWLVRSGFVPCIVGCWAFYLPQMGVDRVKKHWRNLVARYGAYPVVWCLAGEGTMPFYLSDDRPRDAAIQKRGWTEVGRYLREIDPYRRPVTIHPTDFARDQVEDDSVLDYDMLQTGHGGHSDVGSTMTKIGRALAHEPHMPVLNGETCYEGILEGSREEVQRIMFWGCVLSGAAGHTYGANGIWQLNSATAPYGPSPHGTSWGDRSWQEAARLPGSAQVGAGKRILERFEWWRFEPHPEWVEPSAGEGNWMHGYAAGIPGEVRVFYFPNPISLNPWGGPPKLCHLDVGNKYRAELFDPKDGRERATWDVTPDDQGKWTIPMAPVMLDWVLVVRDGA